MRLKYLSIITRKTNMFVIRLSALIRHKMSLSSLLSEYMQALVLVVIKTLQVYHGLTL